MKNVPPTDAIPIALRAYIPRNPTPEFPKPAGADERYVLVFDTETIPDAAQSLRLGVYHFYFCGEIIERGLFHDERNLGNNKKLSKTYLDTMQQFAAEHGYDCISKEDFINNIFLGMAYELGALIVAFNAPYDLSRLAFHASDARRSMRGGFSLVISEDEHDPRLQVKQLSRRAAIIKFAQPRKQKTPRSMRQKDQKVYASPGFFLDVKTLSSALLSRSFSLETLSKLLLQPEDYKKSTEHGGPITSEYLNYAVKDVDVTWKCFLELQKRFDTHGLTKMRSYEIYSEAGLGKAYLEEMGIKPWCKVQPDYDPKTLGIILSTFYGGRAEVKLRREIAQTIYCDFMSMYPSVSALMGLWNWIIASGITHKVYTHEARDFLTNITLDKLNNPKAWKNLCVLVRIKPDKDIFPVRGRYRYTDTKDESAITAQFTTGLNYLSSKEGIWFTMADCVASKLLTGKAPEVIEAICFEPLKPQADLQKICVAGNEKYPVNPLTDDFFKTIIEMRSRIKTEIENAKEDDENIKNLEITETALKILANSTGYGIYVEINVDELMRKKKITCYGYEGKGFSVKTFNIEKSGKYFNPIIGTFITGADRLLLALAEQQAIDDGLGWILCDTDSMAFSKPAKMSFTEFSEKIKRIQNWFNQLNPYGVKSELLKIEKTNYRLDKNNKPTKEFRPLYCYAISAKRYALFNLDNSGNPIIRKASAHGLGHLMPPYEKTSDRKGIPNPIYENHELLDKLGVTLWQHDVWYKILRAAQNDKTFYVESLGKLYDQPAISQYAASNCNLLSWFAGYNALPERKNNYNEQVKPFNFLSAFQAARFSAEPLEDDEESDINNLSHYPRPVAAFNRNPEKAAENCFDRISGKPIPRKYLQSYREALRNYHLHPEAKFLNGNYYDSGLTERRHVEAIASQIRNIGKESNKLTEREEQGADDPEALPDYGLSHLAISKTRAKLIKAGQFFTDTTIAEMAEVSPRYIRYLKAKRQKTKNKKAHKATNAVWMKIGHALAELEKQYPIFDINLRKLFRQAHKIRDKVGSRTFGIMAEYDHSMLGRIINKKRKLSQPPLPSPELIMRLQKIVEEHQKNSQL